MDIETEEVRKYPCRCGGETELEFRDEITGSILIKDVPVLVCSSCGEEWYPAGIPRMIEGLREAAGDLGRVEV
ncbi:MAG: YgiT-type zinc finger protein, partial [Dehalococcoidia bacterium]